MGPSEQKQRLEGYGFTEPHGSEPAGQPPTGDRPGADSGWPTPRFPSTGSWTSPGYRSADTRAKVTQVMYALVALSAIALAVATSGGFELLDRAERFVWEEAAFESWSDSVEGIDAWQSIFAFVAGVSLIIWLSRFVDNVPSLGGGTPKRSPRRVIFYWLVPVFNIDLPAPRAQ